MFRVMERGGGVEGSSLASTSIVLLILPVTSCS
jgi:hypothetical protein